MISENLENGLKGSVLVVDDFPGMDFMCQQLLEREGFKVYAACDGEEAFSKLQNGLQVDLVVSDVNMPKMGGFELIERIKESYPWMPVCLMSGLRENQGDALKRGASAYLAKPWTTDSLINVVETLVKYPTKQLGAFDSV